MCVLARLTKTKFGGVALEGMQELFKDSCKQVHKMTHLYYKGFGQLLLIVLLIQGRIIGVLHVGCERDG